MASRTDRIQKELYPIMALELDQMAADAIELAYGSRKAAHIVTVESFEYWLDQAAQDRLHGRRLSTTQ
jgi:hypothetical protein